MKPSDPSAPAPAAAAPSAASAPFFAVSLPKLAIMSIFSFGLYQVYWFYRNWQLIEKREGRDFALMARALFSVFFCYRLFARVATAGRRPMPGTCVPACWRRSTWSRASFG